ncbi:hypothetical protein HK104_000984 [Borealophlyctis nickersoniae]|nr:hypothetical protein HK104_000984 [Borealophlyctis nickersoniae]
MPSFKTTLPPCTVFANRSVVSTNKLGLRTQTTPAVAVVALGYIERLRKRHPNVKGDEGFEYRLFAVALMLAQKVFEDGCLIGEKAWSEASGIAAKELNIMEREFLLGLDFDMLISPKKLRELSINIEKIFERYADFHGQNERLLGCAALTTLQTDMMACSGAGDADGPVGGKLVVGGVRVKRG